MGGWLKYNGMTLNQSAMKGRIRNPPDSPLFNAFLAIIIK